MHLCVTIALCGRSQSTGKSLRALLSITWHLTFLTKSHETITRPGIVPEYFLPPNWDYEPTSPIQLGNVIDSLKHPHRPLVRIEPDAGMVMKSVQHNVTMQSEAAKALGFSMDFIGSDVGIGYERKYVLLKALSAGTKKSTGSRETGHLTLSKPHTSTLSGKTKPTRKHHTKHFFSAVSVTPAFSDSLEDSGSTNMYM